MCNDWILKYIFVSYRIKELRDLRELIQSWLEVFQVTNEMY